MSLLDCEEVLDGEVTTATEHAWNEPAIGSDAVAKLCYETQLKGFDDVQESYRSSLKSSDAVLAFGGAIVAWLATFISKVSGIPFAFAVLACLTAAISVCLALISRIAPYRPAVQGMPQIHRALSEATEAQAYDWLSRDLWVSRRGMAKIIEIVSNRTNRAIYVQCVAVFLAAIAVCLS